ncbi:energy transducer TonB [Ramlibacter rhizophilus]|uniref:TonB family protein n=1 Tax=Ramlibacter rhizophilus TaxID=1781167 RepID=A0A4Z0BQH5_9BURK|nr:TonB family protein [Ramlibacter rhizophilus]TFZ01537.1 TonB family protein [Ramlibacter rhizophilus]
MNLKRLSTLQIALGLSVAVHAALLTVRIVDPEAFNRVFQDTPLEVVLVNARSDERPDKAQAIAQFSLAGGGDLDKGRATSPLPPSALTATGDSAEDAQARVEAMQEQQMLLLAQAQRQLAALPPPDPRQRANNPEARAREDKRRQLLQLLAEIERRINEENARPKKRYISPSTREEVYAIYYDALRRRIEDRGTQNFPELAGNKLYGELTMLLTVNHDGRMLAAEIVSGSGNPTLDRRAVSIARAASPFGRFNQGMRARADQIVVVSRFRFTREETLETQLSDR